jgi:RimJ/RimL family protein N-acetyltransferase
VGGLRLRPATSGDTRDVFAWRNDPWIVSLGSTRRTVAWEEHAAWFSRVLADPRRLLFICEDEGGAGLGTTRLDVVDDARADVTIYLLREFTGRGLGVRALVQAASEGFARWPIRAIHAHIRADNAASRSAFAKAGFRDTPPGPHCPPDHREMVLTRHGHRIREHYVPLLREHGPTFRAVDWGSAETQALRFRVLLDVGDWRTASILDVGCGVGHLYDELAGRAYAGRYLGIDALGEMVAAARARHPHTVFEEGDILAHDRRWTADYVLGAGLFTFGDAALMQATVRAMFDACARAVAFNTLSARADRQTPGEFHADPDETLAFCRALTPSVTLRHDYLPQDFTVYMYRDAGA